MENSPDLPIKLRIKRGASSLLMSILAALLLCALTVILLLFAGSSLASRIFIYALAAGFIALTVWALYDAIRTFSIWIELNEDGFTYHSFPEGSRVYSYSDCESWRPYLFCKRGENESMIELFMKDGSKLLVDNAMLASGLGAKTGYYGSLPKKGHR